MNGLSGAIKNLRQHPHGWRYPVPLRHPFKLNEQVVIEVLHVSHDHRLPNYRSFVKALPQCEVGIVPLRLDGFTVQVDSGNSKHRVIIR